MFDWFQSIDDALFIFINQQAVHPYFDSFFSTITNLHNVTWFKAFVLPAILLFWIWQRRLEAVKVILVVAAVAGLCDTLGYRVLKPWIDRPRPNHIEALNAEVRLPHRPQSHSFPSNHAVSNFGVASTLAWYYPPLTIVFFAIASLVAYSRIYVGVHFPTDVIGGALIGLSVAWLVRWLILQRIDALRPRRR